MRTHRTKSSPITAADPLDAPRPRGSRGRVALKKAAPTASALLGLPVRDELGLIEQVRAGLSGRTLRSLLEHTQLSKDALGALVRIPARTLTRRFGSGRLTSEESDRVVRFARLFAEAVRLFEGDVEAAKLWLERPSPALGGVTPLSLADTDLGTRAVSELIGRLEHGIPS